MARTLNEIQDQALEAVETTAELNALEVLTDNEQNNLANLTSDSKVAIWRQILFVVSYIVWFLEQLWDVLQADLDKRIEAGKIHNKAWYREKALAFRYGQDLLPESDQYDDTGLTAAQIAASKIIKHAAIQKIIVNGYGTLRAKVAKEVAGERVPLNNAEALALFYYFDEVADGGTAVLITTLPADDLKLELVIYYDPQILDAEGKRLDGTNDTPVIEACEAYTKDIDFNGEFIKTDLKDVLKKVDGVNIPVVKKAWSKYGAYDYDTTGVLNVGIIDEIRVAEAGYMKLDTDNITISYVPRND